MDMKKIALGSAALAAFGLMACGEKPIAKAPAAITANTTDDEKFAYMLGAQFGGQNFTIIPRQMGEKIYEDALVQAIRDNVKANKDTNFKVQMDNDSISYLINEADANELYEHLARERGYVYPDEKVYYDVTPGN